MSVSLNWLVASDAPPLGEGELHLWAIDIDSPLATAESLLATFAADELRRVDQFRFDRPRDRYLAARGALRQILARYLTIAPADIRLVYDGLGKPALDRQTHPQPIEFNLAHSDGLAVLAVTRGCAVGVDVECLRPVRHTEGIARRYFSPTEADDVLDGESATRQARFFCCWTRKEAVVKTIGAGLQFPLDRFRVPVLTGDSTWISLPAYRAHPPQRCWLQPFEPCDEYVGAVSTLEERRVTAFLSLAL